MKLLLAAIALLASLSPTLAASNQSAHPAQARSGHAVKVLRHTTLLKVVRQAPFANSTSSVPLPTWNASAAFTYFPSNTSSGGGNSSSPQVTQAANSTAPKSGGGGGLVGGLLSGLLGPITSGVLGPVTSGLLNGSGSGMATGLPSAGGLSVPTMSSLSLSLLSSVRWPNSTAPGGAAPTGQGNGTSGSG